MKFHRQRRTEFILFIRDIGQGLKVDVDKRGFQDGLGSGNCAYTSNSSGRAASEYRDMYRLTFGFFDGAENFLREQFPAVFYRNGHRRFKTDPVEQFAGASVADGDIVVDIRDSLKIAGVTAGFCVGAFQEVGHEQVRRKFRLQFVAQGILFLWCAWCIVAQVFLELQQHLGIGLDVVSWVF